MEHEEQYRIGWTLPCFYFSQNTSFITLTRNLNETLHFADFNVKIMASCIPEHTRFSQRETTNKFHIDSVFTIQLEKPGQENLLRFADIYCV